MISVSLQRHLYQFLILLFLSGCDLDDSVSASQIPEREADQVLIYQYDGSVQCGEPGIDLETMARSLRNLSIDIYCSEATHDGLSRISVCGADTGNINVYRIDTDNLLAAERSGFRNLEEQPAAFTECR